MNLKKKYIGIEVMFLYKKWSFNVLLNNLIITNFLNIQKKIFFLQFDFYKYYFFNFSKNTSFSNNRILFLKNKITKIS
jgi:hypothetical protein